MCPLLSECWLSGGPSLSEGIPHTAPGRGKGVLWPTAAAPSQGRLQALLDLPLPRPSSPSIPSSGGSRRASSGRVVPTGSGIRTAWWLFYATKFVMVSYVSQDPMASPPHTPVKSIESNCRTGSFHIVSFVFFSSIKWYINNEKKV